MNMFSMACAKSQEGHGSAVNRGSHGDGGVSPGLGKTTCCSLEAPCCTSAKQRSYAQESNVSAVPCFTLLAL